MKNSRLFASMALAGLLSTNAQAATIYYVSPSGDDGRMGTTWETAVKNPQVAINKSTVGDEVWISAGTYLPTEFIDGMTGDPKGRCFIAKDGVSLYGGFEGTESSLTERIYSDFEFKHQTILSGDLAGDDTPWTTNTKGFYEPTNHADNSYHVIWTSGDDNGFNNPTLIDGLTLSGGTATHPDHPHKRGGGILLSRNITLQNCIVTHNIGIAGGGISTLYGTVSACWVDKNIAIDNGGGIANRKTSLIKNSLISDNQIITPNSGEGAGVANYDQSTLTDCLIIGNRSSWFSGGVDNSYKVERCILVDNFATYRGGGAYNGGTMTNCLLANNYSLEEGGGIFGRGNSTSRNCTFANNLSQMAGTDIYFINNAVTTNCIIWNNTCNGGGWIISYTAYTGDPLTGTGNLALSTKEDIFTLPSTFEGNSQTASQRKMLYNINFGLKEGSSCIDAGSDIDAPATDIQGVSRPQGNGIDLGAYEYNGSISISNTEGDSNDYTLINNVFTLKNGTRGVEISDMAGKIIATYAASTNPIEINLTQFSKGLYLIRSGVVGYKILR